MEAYNHLSICREQAWNKVGQILPFCSREQPALSISDFGYCVVVWILRIKIVTLQPSRNSILFFI